MAMTKILNMFRLRNQIENWYLCKVLNASYLIFEQIFLSIIGKLLNAYIKR